MSPILHVNFLQNLPTMNILDPIFYRMWFLNFLPVNPPRPGGILDVLGITSTNKSSRNNNQCDSKGDGPIIQLESWCNRVPCSEMLVQTVTKVGVSSSLEFD